jgi:hypothetical protein
MVGNPVHEKIYDPASMRFKARKRQFTVWILWIDQGEWKMYWCPDCRNPIAQYKGDLIMEHPGIDEDGKYVKPMHPPVLVQCKNSQCGRKILFQGTVKREE